MPTKSKIQLLHKFYKDSITDQELKELFFWLNSEQGSQEYEKLSNKKWLFGEFKTVEDIDSNALFSRIETKMKEKHHIGRKHYLIRIRNAAAIFILGLMFPVVYYFVLNPKETSQVVYLKESISNEKVKKMILPDSTAVWLMSGSTISYPSDFTGNKTRNVRISGEAFFDVAKDPVHPFILNIGEIGLKVMGTSFNVMNYGDENQIQVVLKSGKVDLFKGKYSPDNKFVHLTPGELGTYKKDNPKFLISNVDVAKYTSWTEGILLFHDDPLADVLKKIGRWYNIDIEINDPAVSNFPFTATIKNENMDQIIDLLQYSTPFKYSTYRSNGAIKKLVIEKNKISKPN